MSLACGKSWLSCHHDPITPEDLITGTPKVPAAVPPMSDSVSSDPASPSRHGSGRGAESEPARRMSALIVRVGATELHHSSDVQLGQLSMVGFLVQAQPSVDARCGSGRRKAGRQQGIRKRSNSCAKTWVQDKACSWRKQSLVHCSNLRLSSQPFMHRQVVRGRRLFHEFQTAVTATSERVGQVSG